VPKKAMIFKVIKKEEMKDDLKIELKEDKDDIKNLKDIEFADSVEIDLGNKLNNSLDIYS